jgi:hypothetical protein
VHHLPNSGIQQTCPKLIFHQALWPYHVDNEATFHQTIANALGLSTSSRTELVWLFHASYTATTGAPYVHHARAHCPTHHVLWSFCRSSIFHLPTLHRNIIRVSTTSGFPSSPRGWWPNCTVLAPVRLIPMRTLPYDPLLLVSYFISFGRDQIFPSVIRASSLALLVVCSLLNYACWDVYTVYANRWVCFECVACESLVIAST